MEKQIDRIEIEGAFLGELKVSWRGEVVNLKCTKDSRYMQLFLMLLYHNEKGVSKQEVIDSLYDGKEGSPDNALRIVVYRLRKLLKESCLPKGEYVTTDGNGRYFLGENISVRLDTDEFSSLIRRAEKEESEDEKEKLLEQACEIYRGDFLKEYHGETWIEIENSYFQRIYLKASREWAQILKKKRQYKKLREFTEKNIQLFPFEGWQFILIEGLIAEGKKREAASVYEQTLKDFQEEFGVGLPDDIIEKFEETSRKVYDAQTPGCLIKSVIQKDAEEKGAYYCNYLSFLDCCRVMKRMSQRNKTYLTMLVVSVVNEKNISEITEEEEKKSSLTLREAIRQSVRKEDIYTKYGAGTYMILMIGLKGNGDCYNVFSRIEHTFNNIKCDRNTKIQYRVYPINWK